ncbi:MAG: DUF4197 domain-containing protein [Bacteroidota bacterium]
MMKKYTLLLLLFPISFALSAQNLGGLLKKADKLIKGEGVELSQEETGNALKEALEIGAGKAVDFLSAKDGYYKSAYKILLPEEAQSIVDQVKKVPGFGNVEEELVEKLNRAAEDAAIKAKPIFVEAITSLSFKDAINILMGDQDAATRYLEGSTRQPIYAEFLPVIRTSLDQVQARAYWKKVVTAYNKIPFVKKTNPELDQYVTDKALLGLFQLVEKKELDIRENQASRTSDLLKKVFAQQD